MPGIVTPATMVGLELDPQLDAASITAAVLTTAAANPASKAVKISAYLASIEIDVVPADPHVTVAIAVYDPLEDIAVHKPTRVTRVPTARIWVEKELRNRRADIVPPQAKVAANYLSTMTAKVKARKAGYDEILLVDEDEIERAVLLLLEVEKTVVEGAGAAGLAAVLSSVETALRAPPEEPPQQDGGADQT